jgi:hypothetical protein
MTNQVNINDFVIIHLPQGRSGTMGDGKISKIIGINVVNDKIQYTGECIINEGCQHIIIKFAENEYEVIQHSHN